MSEFVEFHLKLTPKTHTSVVDMAALLGMSCTDIISRAVQLYAMVEMERHMADADIALVDSDGAVHVLSFSGDAAEIRRRFKRYQTRSLVRPRWWPWKRGTS